MAPKVSFCRSMFISSPICFLSASIQFVADVKTSKL